MQCAEEIDLHRKTQQKREGYLAASIAACAVGAVGGWCTASKSSQVKSESRKLARTHNLMLLLRPHRHSYTDRPMPCHILYQLVHRNKPLAIHKKSYPLIMRDIDRCFPMSQGRRRARPSIHLAAAATLLIFSPSPSRHSAGSGPVLVAAAAASSPLYNAYQYDMTIPQFTPDGRLLQVEYASRAPEQSGPLVAVPVWSNDGDEENDDGPSVVIASIVARSPSSENDSKEEEDYAADYEKNGARVPTSKRRQKGQSRLIPLPLGPTLFSAPGAPPTPARSIVVGLSGILADATSLLGVVQDDLTQYRRMYGLGKLHAVLPTHSAEGNSGCASATSATQAAPTVVARRVARGVGRYCQRNSFGGGIRPFGASLVICGVDESGVCICVTEPSGAVLANQFSLDALRKKSSNALKDGDEENNDREWRQCS